jgi:hypothetical protein
MTEIQLYAFLFKDFGAFGICIAITFLVGFLASKLNELTNEKITPLTNIPFIVCLLGVLTSFIISIYTHLSATRDGAICEDLWVSHSTGSGTCSSHGGVKEWNYHYWYED